MHVAIPSGQPWDDGRWVCGVLQAAGHEAWLVGGCVRDLLLGRAVHDVDVATSAHPEQVEALFAKSLAVGKSFGVMIAITPTGSQVEIATFRNDGAYVDGRRPSGVTFATAIEDVHRRDFTINGLLLDPDGTVVDHLGGIADLESRTLRVIDGAQRLAEDRLRVLRGIRFAAHLALTPTPDTWAALIATELSGLSRERIWQEIGKGLSQRPAAWFQLLAESGHLAALWPSLQQAATNQIVAALAQVETNDDVLLPLAIVLHFIADPEIWRWLQREPLPRARVQRLRDLTYAVQTLRAGCDLAARRRLLRGADAAVLVRLTTCLGVIPEARTWFAAEQTCGALPPLLTAKDLLAVGILPGPHVGRLLSEVTDLQLTGELHDAAAAIAWVRKNAPNLN